MIAKSLEMIGYEYIMMQLKQCALTNAAKEKLNGLMPYVSVGELKKNMSETSQARRMIDLAGTPPIPVMEGIEGYLHKAESAELLLPEELEAVSMFLSAVERLMSYLKRGEERQISIAFYRENLCMPTELKEEIDRCIRGGRVDDYASSYLKDLRRQIASLLEKLTEKAERALKANKAYVSDSFVVKRNGRLCIPVKKEYKGKVQGTVVEKSATGSTLFMEPAGVTQLYEDLLFYQMEEENEERRILYTLMDAVAQKDKELKENIRVIIKLDVMFAKGKLSQSMNAIEPKIHTQRSLMLSQARHPMLDAAKCVPLDFETREGIRGVIITGPNTGGKTVAIKTVALLCAMACSGLHIPCTEAIIPVNSQILCDIGDGQDISDNLSTFSAHMKNVLEILKHVDEESLVIMDELGSGTDPAEGMGIAVAILEQLRKSKALFLVTTHYPEVKEYADRQAEIENARMEFDKESLKPLYRLKVGKSGESCALYIAKHLGIPNEMLRVAAKEAYGEQAAGIIQELGADSEDGGILKVKVQSVKKEEENRVRIDLTTLFNRGDSVTVSPDQKIGIVVKPADLNGNVLVQIQQEKSMINYKRLKLKVAAKELYPEDYDFSIVFDTVEMRKKRHKMSKRHQEGMVLKITEQ